MNTTKADMIALFQALAGSYPNWKASAATFELYAMVLADVPIERLRRAVVMHMRKSQWPPTPAELRALAGDQDKIGPEEAWEEVRSQVRSIGWSGTPTYSTPEIARAVSALGGWRSLCATPTSDMGVSQAHFMRCYSAYTSKTEFQVEAAKVERMLGTGAAGQIGDGE